MIKITTAKTTRTIAACLIQPPILDAVKSAVTYPVAMLGMLLVIVTVLFIKVMPVFEQVYMQLGQEMTGVARQLLYIGGWMRHNFYK